MTINSLLYISSKHNISTNIERHQIFLFLIIAILSNSKISKSERSNVDKASLGPSTIGSPCRLNEV